MRAPPRLHSAAVRVRCPAHRQLTSLPRTQPHLTPQLRRSRDDLQYVVDDIQRMARKAESLVELYRFCKESHQEQVLRTLTIVTTIFIPGQFMSGVWGMNFENMPELQLKYGYYLFWAIFVTMGSVVLLYFWSQGWFSHEARGAYRYLKLRSD